jgi:hypothetical protein
MREKTPEQLSIFDLMPELEKPEEFYMPDSFKGFKKGVEHKGKAFEKARYIGDGEIANNLFTIYVRKATGPSGERYIVSVPAIDFDFGYNSMEKMLSEWELFPNTQN